MAHNRADERQGGGWANPFAIGMALGLGLALAEVVRRRPDVDPHAHLRLAFASPLDPEAWRRIAARAFHAFNEDRISAAAAGVTFYMLLALFPALSAFISLYGLVADVADAERHVATLAGLLPGGALDLLVEELRRLAQTDHGALGIAFAVSLATSIWSANAGARAVIEALNVAYETPERRGFIGQTLLSLAFTVGAILLAIAALTLVVVAPALLARLGLAWSGGPEVRWPLFVAGVTLLLSVVYRFGPDRRFARWRWVTPGGAIAALGWLAMSELFSWYVANFGSYDRTYGSLGAIVGFLTWIWISLMVVLFGAELNNEFEKAVGEPPPRSA